MASTVTQGGAFSGPMNSPRESVVDRFLRYVRIETQSSETATIATEHRVAMDARQSARRGARAARRRERSRQRILHGLRDHSEQPAAEPLEGVPTIGFLAHVDTSPAVTGANVKPIIHRNYQGGDIVLPGDPTQVITVAQNPDLAKLIGDDIITTDGTTLLGSDDKSGVAAIMTLVDTLAQQSADPARRRSRSGSRPTRRSARASTTSTSRRSAPTSPTPSTAVGSARSIRKRGALGWRRSRSTARACTRERRRA